MLYSALAATLITCAGKAITGITSGTSAVVTVRNIGTIGQWAAAVAVHRTFVKV